MSGTKSELGHNFRSENAQVAPRTVVWKNELNVSYRPRQTFAKLASAAGNRGQMALVTEHNDVRQLERCSPTRTRIKWF